MRLIQLQRGFANSIYNNDTNSGLISIIRSDTISPSARLAVYRNNVHQALINALVLTYPVLSRIVDEGFFRYAAKEYIRAHPSMSGNLEDYGRDMAHFLETFEPVAHLPYLADMARFEWGYVRCDQAPECEPINISALQYVTEKHYEGLCFEPHPGASIVESSYPIYTLWQQVIDNPEKVDVDLASGGERILIYRQGMEAKVALLSQAEMIFVRVLLARGTLYHAYEEATAAEDGDKFDLIASLSESLRRNVFVGFAVK